MKQILQKLMGIFKKKELEIKDIKSINENKPSEVPKMITDYDVNNDGFVTLKNNKKHKYWNLSNHTSWGNRIDWNETGETIEGHALGVEEGDFIISAMSSGKEGLYLIKEMRRCEDPRDQFFADVIGLGYVDEIGVKK